MHDEEQIAFERDDDSLAETAHGIHALAFGGGKRRNDRAQDERTQQAYALDPRPHDALGEALDVDDDVRQLRHC